MVNRFDIFIIELVLVDDILMLLVVRQRQPSYHSGLVFFDRPNVLVESEDSGVVFRDRINDLFCVGVL